MTIRQTIIDDEQLKANLGDVQRILHNLSQARTDANVAEKVLADYRLNGIRANKERLAAIENEYAFDVANNPDLKNEKARKAALEKLITESLVYQDAKADLLKSEQQENDLIQKIAKHKADLEFFRNQFYAWQSEMNLAAALGQEQQEHRIMTETKITTDVNGGTFHAC